MVSKPLEEQLNKVIAELVSEFDKVHSVDTITTFVWAAHDELAGQATIPDYLPLLVHRAVRERLRKNK